MATMGFAPAAAIGAKIGAPDRKVICLVGDGGFMSVVGALTTAVELGVPVVVGALQQLLLLDDPHGRHHVLQEQPTAPSSRTPDGKPYNPDFLLLARAFGIESALRRGAGRSRRRRLKTAIAANVPYLLEVRTRGDVPMPRTGYWDIADFLAHGND